MKIKCPLCDFENEEGARFCSNCNTPLVKPKTPNATKNPYIKIKKEKPETLLDNAVDWVDDNITNFQESIEGGNKTRTK